MFLWNGVVDPSKQQASRIMPPADVDAMIQDVSNHMAKAQLLRRLSANSSSTTSSSKRGSMRIVKGNNGGTSPHNVQRRKTTASHTAKANHTAIQDSAYQHRVQGVENSYRTQSTFAATRPMSWHPESGGFERSFEDVPINDSALRYTIAGFQGLATSNFPASSGESMMEPSPPARQHHASNEIPTIYGHSNVRMDGYPFHGAESGNAYLTYTLYDSQGMDHHLNNPIIYGYDVYPSQEFQQQGWPYINPDLTTNIPLQTADFLPIQRPVENSDAMNQDHVPQISKKRSKELVGMGLYDSPEKDISSNLGYGFTTSNQFLGPNRPSMGKGLKLEETWHPPKEQDEVEDDGEEEEAYSTDEGEDDLPVAPVAEEAQEAFYPTYGDLSNQSFFFENDEQYSNCIAFDQGIQVCQPKGPDAGGQNFLWF